MAHIPSNDPYAPVPLGQDDSGPSVFSLLRVATSLVGIGLILTGVALAVWSFSIVRGILESPENLNTYLDAWYIESPIVTTEPDAKPAESIPAPPPIAAPVENAPKAEPAPIAPSVDPAKPADTKESGLERLARANKNNPAPAVRRPSPAKASDIGSVLREVIENGGIARLVGAGIILILVSILVRIPFGLIKAGIEITCVMTAERSKDKT